MTLVSQHIILQSPASNDPLLDLNTQPSLDLQFATGKTLDDRVSGLPLVNHQRDASSGKSAGTYVGSDGLIKTSGVNLQPYSEITVNWATQGSTLSPDFALAPIGTNAAAQIIPSSGIVEGRIFYPSSLTGQLTASCFFKPNGYDFATIGLFKGSNYASIIVNLLTGEVTAVSSGAVPEAYSVTDAGNGWKRLSVTTTTVNSYVSLAPAPDASTTLNTFGLVDAATFDGTSGVLAWGAQLEEGTTATTYIPTTSTISGAPRFDHDPVTGESLGLLVEESRINLLTYSERFDQWNPANIAVATNATTAPDGASTAAKLSSTTGTWASFCQQSFAGSGTRVLSVFAKAAESSWIGAGGIGAAGELAWFNLSTGLPGAKDANVLSSSMEAFPDGWYRCSLVCDFQSYGGVIPVSGDNSINIAPVGDGIFIWGAQLEAGSFPTSYIPTTSSTVTRAADAASITGTNFSSWYNSTAGSFYADVKAYGTSSGSSRISGTDQIATPLYYNTTADIIKSYGNTVGPTVSGLIAFGRHKAGMAYATGDEAISVNGGTVVTSAVGFNNTLKYSNRSCFICSDIRLRENNRPHLPPDLLPIPLG